MCHQPPGTDVVITFKASLMRGRFKGDGAAVRGLLHHRAPAPLPALRTALPGVLLASPTLCCPRPARRLGEGEAPRRRWSAREDERRRGKTKKKEEAREEEISLKISAATSSGLFVILIYLI